VELVLAWGQGMQLWGSTEGTASRWMSALIPADATDGFGCAREALSVASRLEEEPVALVSCELLAAACWKLLWLLYC